MQYFQTNFETLTSIATLCGFDGLAGYLILARHATSSQILHYPPYVLSGAGVNSIHEKLGCSELRAKNILSTLAEGGFIAAAPDDAKQLAPQSARWLLPRQYPLNLELPQDLVDKPDFRSSAPVNSALKRLKKLPPLTDQTKSQANCDGTALLLALYADNQMRKFGGLPFTTAVGRKWATLSVRASEFDGCYEWKAEPVHAVTYEAFIRKALPHLANENQNTVLQHFWHAFNNLQEVGLVYEVVTLFSKKQEILAPLRVNDFHAGSNESLGEGDPSVLKELENAYGTQLAFYQQDPENLRCLLPFKEGEIHGIYRLRFRCGNADTGQWFEEDVARVQEAFNLIEESVGVGYDDDF